MNLSNGPYISNLSIKNFRNFKETKVNLSHKQVIIGENNVGKTNLIKALQLILDPKLSDDDRYLVESDFFEGLDSPMDKGEEVEISIEIKGYEHNKTLLAVLCDSSINSDPATLRLTYKYFAEENSDGTYSYQYKIYQGNNEDNHFTHYHRRFLNMKVIPAIRDVDSDLKNIRKSPVNQLLKSYDIRKEELETIAAELKETSDKVLNTDELIHLTSSISTRFSDIIGEQVDSSVSLETIDLDPSRILNSLKIMMGKGKRPTSETSLGLTNILYISLILLLLEDKTIPSILNEDTYIKLLEEQDSGILPQCYVKRDSGKYVVKENIENDSDEFYALYGFMEDHYSSNNGFTILAIEEPEAHLHPALQRIIFKDVMENSTSVLMTTHSPYITSVAPLNSIVHLRFNSNGTSVKTTASLQLEPRERKDLERYIDVKKGELYFGKGVVLVEGVAEEYLVPKFSELLLNPLDKKGIICCNINSTNFKPYVHFLNELGIPYVVITDGDYYYKVLENDTLVKKFGSMIKKEHTDFGYDGLDRTEKLLLELGMVTKEEIPEDLNERDDFFADYYFFIGLHTLEIDLMHDSKFKNSGNVIKRLFDELTSGGQRQKENFNQEFDAKNFVSCLKKIESKHSKIGKGRFAQALSTECTKENIPDYIETAIDNIYSRVDTL
ncbi:ATP-dependent nuclease [Radiobacillus sp. PE A8.2]|uniref:ATP-dependent nuclease n=1 Tax=Radiobacillus sp. PE A8.2 TaxID=3380349 RepID=UPI003890E50F